MFRSSHVHLLILAAALSPVLSCSNETRPNPGSIRHNTPEPTVASDAGSSSNAQPETAPGTQTPETKAPDTADKPAAPATTPPTMAAPAAGTAATGKVTVDFTPVAPVPAGNFSPRNIMAVWVTDANNTLVRTLFATPAGVRAQYLRRWQQLSQKQADGFTGATMNAITKPAAPLVWDMKNRTGTAVPNGNYKVWFEIASDNIPALPAGTTNAALSGTLAIDTANGYKSLIVPIVVGPTGSNKTDTTNQAFTNVSIVHTP